MADYYTKPAEQRLDADSVSWTIKRAHGGPLDGEIIAVLEAAGLERKVFTLEDVFGGDSAKANALAAALKAATVAEAQAQGLVKEGE